MVMPQDLSLQELLDAYKLLENAYRYANQFKDAAADYEFRQFRMSSVFSAAGYDLIQMADTLERMLFIGDMLSAQRLIRIFMLPVAIVIINMPHEGIDPELIFRISAVTRSTF